MAKMRRLREMKKAKIEKSASARRNRNQSANWRSINVMKMKIGCQQRRKHRRNNQRRNKRNNNGENREMASAACVSLIETAIIKRRRSVTNEMT